MLRTQVIIDKTQFYSLRNEWNNLLQDSLTNTVFLTWEWLYAWWEVFGTGSELFIILVRDDSDKLVGIAPLFIKKTKYYIFPVKEMTFIGVGHSDRQDFIVSKGEQQILQEIIRKISENSHKWHIVHLEQIPDHSPCASASFPKNMRLEKEQSSTCPYIKINGNEKSYFNNLGKKLNRDLQHKRNRMKRFGEWKFNSMKISSDHKEIIRALADVEKKSRKKNRGELFLENSLNMDFINRFCSFILEKDWLDISHIEINQNTIAYLLGFRYNDAYCAYNMAFHEQYRQASPGKLLLSEKIKWCFENSTTFKEFDFLRGDAYIKQLWTSESRKHLRIVFFKDSHYSMFIRFVVFKLRPLIKKLINKKR